VLACTRIVNQALKQNMSTSKLKTEVNERVVSILSYIARPLVIKERTSTTVKIGMGLIGFAAFAGALPAIGALYAGMTYIFRLFRHRKKVNLVYLATLQALLDALGGDHSTVKDQCILLEDKIAERIAKLVNDVERQKAEESNTEAPRPAHCNDSAVELHKRFAKLCLEGKVAWKRLFKYADSRSLEAATQKFLHVLLVRQLRHVLHRTVGVGLIGVTKAGKSGAVAMLSNWDAHHGSRYDVQPVVPFVW